MATSKCTSAAVWEAWYSRNPLMRGEPIGEVPVSWLQWLREAPAVGVNADGEVTLPLAPDARRVQTSCPLRRAAGQRGSALLETALCLPILLLVVLGGLDLANAMRSKSSLDYIVGQAAKCTVTYGCDPQALVAANAQGLGLAPGRLTVVVDAGTATATGSYQYPVIGPFFPQITLRSTASAAK